MTIQRIGKKPYAAPSLADSSAGPNGIPNATTATTIDTTSEISPAIQAFIRRTPSSTNRVIRGRAAQSADNPRDPLTGARTCLNTFTSPLRRAPGARVGTSGDERSAGRGR